MITTNNSIPEPPSPSAKNRGGRPKKDLTPEQKVIIERMARQGISQKVIARVYEIDPKTLRKHCARELANANLCNNLDVLETLFAKATSARHVSATIYWVKTRCRHLLDDAAGAK